MPTKLLTCFLFVLLLRGGFSQSEVPTSADGNKPIAASGPTEVQSKVEVPNANEKSTIEKDLEKMNIPDDPDSISARIIEIQEQLRILTRYMFRMQSELRILRERELSSSEIGLDRNQESLGARKETPPSTENKKLSDQNVPVNAPEHPEGSKGLSNCNVHYHLIGHPLPGGPGYGSDDTLRSMSQQRTLTSTNHNNSPPISAPGISSYEQDNSTPKPSKGLEKTGSESGNIPPAQFSEGSNNRNSKTQPAGWYLVNLADNGRYERFYEPSAYQNAANSLQSQNPRRNSYSGSDQSQSGYSNSPVDNNPLSSSRQTPSKSDGNEGTSTSYPEALDSFGNQPRNPASGLSGALPTQSAFGALQFPNSGKSVGDSMTDQFRSLGDSFNQNMGGTGLPQSLTNNNGALPMGLSQYPSSIPNLGGVSNDNERQSRPNVQLPQSIGDYQASLYKLPPPVVANRLPQGYPDSSYFSQILSGNQNSNPTSNMMNFLPSQNPLGVSSPGSNLNVLMNQPFSYSNPAELIRLPRSSQRHELRSYSPESDDLGYAKQQAYNGGVRDSNPPAERLKDPSYW